MDFSQKKNSFFKKDFKIILKKFRFFLFQMVFITSIQSLKSSKLLWLPDMNELLLCFFFKLYIDCFTVLVTFEINSSSWAYFAQWLKKNESIGRIDQNRSKWINSGNLQEKEIFIIHWQKRKENKKKTIERNEEKRQQDGRVLSAEEDTLRRRRMEEEKWEERSEEGFLAEATWSRSLN